MIASYYRALFALENNLDVFYVYKYLIKWEQKN